MTEEIIKETLNEESRNVLESRLTRMKEQMHDIGIQVREIDFHVNELLDLNLKLRKRTLAEKRHELMSEANTLAMSIAELQKVLFNNGYNVKINKESDEKDG